MCRKAQRRLAGSCQLRQRDLLWWRGGKPVITLTVSSLHGGQWDLPTDAHQHSVSAPRNADEAGSGQLAVTAANWQEPPYNRWAFWHVGDILPTQRDRCARAGPRAAAGRGATRRRRRLRGRGRPGSTVASDRRRRCWPTPTPTLTWCCRTARWSPSGTAPRARPDRTHALMSVTKSVVGCVAARAGRPRPARPRRPRHRATSPSWPAAATPAPRCGTCSTCAAGSGSSRTTPTRTPRSRSWTSGWAGDPAQDEPRGLYPFLARCGRGAARRAVPVPLGRDRRAGLGVRARRRPADGRADLDADLAADGCRARRRDHLRRPRHRRARRRPVRDRARPGPVRADAARRRRGAGRRRTAPVTVVRPAGCAGPWAVDADVAVGVRGVAGRAVVARRLVPQPVLVPSRRATAMCCCAWASTARWCTVSRRTRTVCVKFSTWPDAQNPRLPAGHAARLRRRRRVPRRPALQRGPARLAGVVSGLSRRGDADRPRTAAPDRSVWPVRSDRSARRRYAAGSSLAVS